MSQNKPIMLALFLEFPTTHEHFTDQKMTALCFPSCNIYKSMLEMLRSLDDGVSIMKAKYFPPHTSETEGLNYQ